MVANKLCSVKPVLGDWQSSYRWCRKDEIVLYCVHIGHTQLMHSYILKKDPIPQCEHCPCILTVHHTLVKCNHLDEKGKRYLVGVMWWNNLDSTPHLVYFILKSDSL